MARSKEALLKRALRRGITVEEQMRLERQRERGGGQRSTSGETARSPVIAATKTVVAKVAKIVVHKRVPQDYVKEGGGSKGAPFVAKTSTKWHCDFCNNSNFDIRILCNRCQRKRAGVKSK